MLKPKILVTAATGKTGAPTTMQLLKKGFPVRALVHSVDERSRRLERAGAEIVVGSLEDIFTLKEAMSGVQRAYFCSPLIPGTLRRATLFAAAAEEAKLEVVVALSQWLADPLHPALHSREKWLSERVFDWIPNVDVITINPGFFAENYLLGLEAMAHFGLMALPLGEGLNAPPSNEDIAKVITGSLADPGLRIGNSYRPTGPRLLSPNEIASTIGKVLGRKVRYQNAPIKLFFKAARSLRIPDFVIEELNWYLQEYQRNSFGIGAPTDAVAEIGGSAPEDFESIVRRYVVSSTFNHRTPGSMARATINLLRALATPSPDLRKISGRLELPMIEHAVLVGESSFWV